VRLELLPLWDVQVQKEERKSGAVPIPVYLLTELKYFPSMVQVEDADAFKIYLALLRNFSHTQDVRLTAVFEDLAQELPIDRESDKSGVIFQVMKALERLSEKYGLLKIEKQEPERAGIRFSLSEKNLPAVGVPAAFFEGNYAKELSVYALYAYFVILYRCQTSGDSPVWLGSEINVENDFPIPHDRFRLVARRPRRRSLARDGRVRWRRRNARDTTPAQLRGVTKPGGQRYTAAPLRPLHAHSCCWHYEHRRFTADDGSRG